MRSVCVSASAIVLSLAAPVAPCAAQPGPESVVTRTNEGSSSAYTGRFYPSTYSYDNGVAPIRLGTNNGPIEFLWMHRYDAAGGDDAITSVSLTWGNIPAGTTARVYIFKDPNNDGNPADRVLLASQDITVQNPCACTNPTFNVYPLDAPVPVSGVIYVGASVIVQSGQFPLHVDNATPFVAGRSYFGLAVPPLNASTVALAVRSTLANPETYFIRANGSNAGFTYQGSLSVSDAPYTGAADLLIGIFDAESDGNAVSTQFSIPAVSVNNGMFSVRIPADASSFDPGADRWLEIAVKRAGEAGYATLSPRQRITSVPTALAAARVNWSGITNVPASLPPWNQVASGISYTAGRVGVGTSVPSDTLHVRGTARFFGPIHGGDIALTDFAVGGGSQLLGLVVGNNAGPQLRFLTASNATNFIDVGQNTNGDFVVEGNDIPRLFVGNAGNVGIGTTDAPHRLTVNGNVSASNVLVPSSVRFKDHVRPLNDALDALLKLDGVRFDWKPEFAATRPGREHDLGFVAEDVEKIFPELVFRDADGNVTGMDYSRLTAVAVAAIKEQQARFEADKAAKQREIDELKARLDRIEAALKAQR